MHDCDTSWERWFILGSQFLKRSEKLLILARELLASLCGSARPVLHIELYLLYDNVIQNPTKESHLSIIKM